MGEKEAAEGERSKEWMREHGKIQEKGNGKISNADIVKQRKKWKFIERKKKV